VASRDAVKLCMVQDSLPQSLVAAVNGCDRRGGKVCVPLKRLSIL
jgi:hypothetical protein